LQTIPENRYENPGKHAFMNTNTTSHLKGPPKRMSSYDLLKVVSPKSPQVNNKGILSSMISPQLSKEEFSAKLSAQLVNSASLNENGILGVMMSDLRKDRAKKIKNAIEKMNINKSSKKI